MTVDPSSSSLEDPWFRAKSKKDEGNDHFKKGNYRQAVICYSDAIDISEEKSEELVDIIFDNAAKNGEQNGEQEGEKKSIETVNPEIHVYFCNRAFCHIKQENFGSAIMDATRAIEIKPEFGKGYYRRGVSKYAMAKYKEALIDFKRVCKLAPSDKDARLKLKDCEKVVAQERFAAAIASDKTKPISQTVDLDKIILEEKYDGPIYNGRENLTKEWVENFVEYMKDQKVIAKKSAYMMVFDMLELLKTHKTLQYIDIKDDEEFTVCGDIHGQFYDLLNIWEKNGRPSETNPYLFNGDFIDRGSFSMECILALIAYKLLYPQHMHMSRGNHESKNMNKLYGFEGECIKKFDNILYELFCELFCYLPLCHVINKQIFVVHGGLFSKDGVTLEDIEKVDRICEPPDEGLMTEMLWSDPQFMNGRAPSKRGVGVAFGPNVTEDFLETNNLKMVVRSHEMKDEGYEKEHGGKCITVFSAPNYCDTMGNKGAFIRFDGKTLTPKIVSFEHVPHPSVKPMQYANPLLGQMML